MSSVTCDPGNGGIHFIKKIVGYVWISQPIIIIVVIIIIVIYIFLFKRSHFSNIFFIYIKQYFNYVI